MKKTIILMLLLAVILSLCACGSAAPTPTPEPTQNPKEVLYDKYADIIDALEAEDYDAAAEALEARRPAPEVTEVEITMDNLWDYFEITEERHEQSDAQGELYQLEIWSFLALKDGLVRANSNDYHTDVAVGFEYDSTDWNYLKPCTVDFETFTCNGSVTWHNTQRGSKMAHYPDDVLIFYNIADSSPNLDAVLLHISENLEILNASGTLYLENN